MEVDFRKKTFFNSFLVDFHRFLLRCCCFYDLKVLFSSKTLTRSPPFPLSRPCHEILKFLPQTCTGEGTYCFPPHPKNPVELEAMQTKTLQQRPCFFPIIMEAMQKKCDSYRTHLLCRQVKNRHIFEEIASHEWVMFYQLLADWDLFILALKKITHN